jgi:tRNA(Leu) C34 or U34 (ribose-2'-O)-methylase TrmL
VKLLFMKFTLFLIPDQIVNHTAWLQFPLFNVIFDNLSFILFRMSESGPSEKIHKEDITFQIYKCTRTGCELRFTVQAGQTGSMLCPACRADLEEVGTPFGRNPVSSEANRDPGTQVEVLLDNIRSAWNVGSMLRTCDGAGVRHVHLCGVSPLPNHPKVAKTSLGAEKTQPWTFHPDGQLAAQQLKDQGLRIWALEGGLRAVSLFDVQAELAGPPIVLSAGNGLSGVGPGLLELCERVVCLPMQGMKSSLNVAVAFGAAVYYLRFGSGAGEVKG